METNNNDPTSLEGPKSSASNSASGDAVIETNSLENSSTPDTSGSAQPAAVSKKHAGPTGIKKLTHKVNIYLLLFILILVIAGAVLVITAMSSQTTDEAKISSQSVPTDTLKQLAKTDATVGDPKQVLNVQSNAVFAGKVLIRDSLDVAGKINVSGPLTLPGITVSGDSVLDQLQVNKALNVGGDASILGQLNVRKNLSVSGGGTFGGPVTAPQIAANQLQLLGDLTITSHIIAGGSTPGRSNGTALGSGGTSSVGGSDTAGSININTGSAAAVGCFINVTFTSRFSDTPSVVVTPIGSSAGAIDYYVNRSSTGFSVCTVSDPPDNSNFGFDYIVLG